MRPPKHNWPNTNAGHGVLMLAQQMAEMLAPQTFESYRVYTLCTVSRLYEISRVIDDVQRNRVNRLALDPVLKELSWSLDKDPVAKVLAEEEVESLQKLIRPGHVSLPELSAHVMLLRRLIGKTYKSALEELLLKNFDKPDGRNAFRVLIGFYCSHLVNRGYSKQYIARLVDDEFFNQQRGRVGAALLRRFFKQFKDKPSRFKVYVAVSKEFGKFLQHLGFTVQDGSAVGHEIRESISVNADRPLVLVADQEAFDSYSAMVRQNQVLTNIRALTYLAPQGLSSDWSSRMFVLRHRTVRGVPEEQVEISFDKPAVGKRPSARQYKSVRSYSSRILSNFDRRSTERLLASMSTSALARTTSSIENKLISLWSAVEVLLSEPEPETPRIVHYTKLLMPCICLRHMRLQFAAMSDEFLISYRRKYKEIVFKEDAVQGIDLHSRFASVLLLPQFASLRDELLKLCGSNPLARHRLYRLNNDFKDPTNVLKTIGSHEKRVEWQIHRIYRARNYLVHAGRVPTYLDSLIMNLFEYYRASIGTIANRARQEDKRSDVDQIVAEIGIEYGMFKQHFQNRRGHPLEIDDLKRLIFFSANNERP